MNTNTSLASDFYAAKADLAFARWDDACNEHGSHSDAAQTAKRQYQSAFTEYLNSVALETI